MSEAVDTSPTTTIRRVASRFVGTGWRRSTNGLRYRGAAGHFGRIAFEPRGFADPVRDKAISQLGGDLGAMLGAVYAGLPTTIEVSAGVGSPYLLRVVNHRKPEKMPPAGFEHAWLVGPGSVGYANDHAGPSTPLPVPSPYSDDIGITVGRANFEIWLDDAFARLVRAVESLGSDLAIRDYLVRTAGPTNYVDVRLAVILTKHLRRQAELTQLLDAESEAVSAAEAVMALHGQSLSFNDRDSNMVLWSRKRFRRFLEELNGGSA